MTYSRTTDYKPRGTATLPPRVETTAMVQPVCGWTCTGVDIETEADPNDFTVTSVCVGREKTTLRDVAGLRVWPPVPMYLQVRNNTDRMIRMTITLRGSAMTEGDAVFSGARKVSP